MGIRNVALALAFWFAAGTALAGDLEDGNTAYKLGDYKKALHFFKPLAERGSALAQFGLGVMYDQGHGVPQNYKEALKWYRLAADQGHADAQSSLGLMYKEGLGVPQDDKEVQL
jgi:TPR repeat protein